MQNKSKTAKKLSASVAIIFLLSVCLCITTFALMFSMVSVGENIFATGTVKINLNDGKPVIEEQEFLFAPGMTVKKEFFVENESSCDVWYRLYFQNVVGGLADVLDVKICDGEKVLFSGTPNELKRENVKAADDMLAINERRTLQIYFHFPESSGDESQDLYLNFDFAAEAVQTKNNENKNFK